MVSLPWWLYAEAAGLIARCSLCCCVLEMAPTTEDEWGRRPVVSPQRLNAELVHKLVSFRGKKQQDSQELLQFLMSLVGDEQKRFSVRDKGLCDLWPTQHHDTLQAAAMASRSISDLRFDEALEEKHWNPLHGLQVNLLQCTHCKRYRPMRNQRFLDVSLSFGTDQQPKKQITLMDCLELYTAPEAIEGVECSYCSIQQGLEAAKQAYSELQQQDDDEQDDSVAQEIQQLELQDCIYALERMLTTTAELPAKMDRVMEQFVPRVLQNCHKRLQFSRSPDVFCFHFNRKVYNPWSGSTRKLDWFVSFPLVLDMNPFCAYEQDASEDKQLSSQSSHHDPGSSNALWMLLPGQQLQQQQHLIYELTAVIVHLGNDRAGHFTAYRRIANGQWFYVSDDAVREASADEVLRSCAYMLFYERAHRPKTSRWSHTSSSTDEEDSLPDLPLERPLL